MAGPSRIGVFVREPQIRLLPRVLYVPLRRGVFGHQAPQGVVEEVLGGVQRSGGVDGRGS